MKKRIALIIGHPDKESYNFALAEAYKKGVKASGFEIQEIIIRELEFNPNLQYGYRKRTELEPDLLNSQKILKWADHLVFVYPIWWSSMPAIMKGFIDRILLSGYAFKKRENSLLSDKLLTGKTARLICTLDQPPWFYRLVYGRPSYKAMNNGTLNYIGVKKVACTSIGPIRLSKEKFRLKYLKKVEKLGRLSK